MIFHNTYIVLKACTQITIKINDRIYYMLLIAMFNSLSTLTFEHWLRLGKYNKCTMKYIYIYSVNKLVFNFLFMKKNN